MRQTLSLVLALAAVASFADNLTKTFIPGRGSRFDLTIAQGLHAQMLVYISESSASLVGVETYLSAKPLPIELWQQTRLRPSEKAAAIADAFIYSEGFSAPEKMDLSTAAKNSGFQVADFLFSGGSELQKNKVGEETLQTPAGTMASSHYRQTRGKQTLDYWISDEAKPIGLVKLISTTQGKTAFQLELGALLKNVQRKINPAKAVPLSQKGKALLSLSGGMGLMP